MPTLVSWGVEETKSSLFIEHSVPPTYWGRAGFTGAESEEVREDEAKSVAMLPRRGDGLGWRVRVSSSCRVRCTSLGIFCTYLALTSAGVCDRTLRPEMGRGAVPCPAAQLQSCPAFYCSTSR